MANFWNYRTYEASNAGVTHRAELIGFSSPVVISNLEPAAAQPAAPAPAPAAPAGQAWVAPFIQLVHSYALCTNQIEKLIQWNAFSILKQNLPCIQFGYRSRSSVARTHKICNQWKFRTRCRRTTSSISHCFCPSTVSFQFTTILSIRLRKIEFNEILISIQIF